MKISKRSDIGKFSVILADPPWGYQNWSDSKNGAAKSQYETMSAEDIGEIPIQNWVAEDCILFLWGTWPGVKKAIDVMDSWGFEQVTGFPWIKTVPTKSELHFGIGFWARGVSEYVLIGRRGSPKRTKVDVLGLLHGENQTFYAPVGRHSVKPIRLTTWIEKSLPGPYLELFGRRPRPNWTVLGRALGHELGPWGVRSYNPKISKEGLFASR
jgi:N6-adenosine-specific RNA methylase IME4